MLISACGQGEGQFVLRDRKMSMILSAAEQNSNELLALSLPVKVIVVPICLVVLTWNSRSYCREQFLWLIWSNILTQLQSIVKASCPLILILIQAGPLYQTPGSLRVLHSLLDQNLRWCSWNLLVFLESAGATPLAWVSLPHTPTWQQGPVLSLPPTASLPVLSTLGLL